MHTAKDALVSTWPNWFTIQLFNSAALCYSKTAAHIINSFNYFSIKSKYKVLFDLNLIMQFTDNDATTCFVFECLVNKSWYCITICSSSRHQCKNISVTNYCQIMCPQTKIKLKCSGEWPIDNARCKNDEIHKFSVRVKDKMYTWLLELQSYCFNSWTYTFLLHILF